MNTCQQATIKQWFKKKDKAKKKTYYGLLGRSYYDSVSFLTGKSAVYFSRETGHCYHGNDYS